MDEIDDNDDVEERLEKQLKKIDEKTSEEQKHKKITCMNCENSYFLKLRRCPKCSTYNPLYDFNLNEFFINISLGYLTILIPLFIILALASNMIYITGILLSPVVIIRALVEAAIFYLLFYLGRSTRDWLNKKNEH